MLMACLNSYPHADPFGDGGSTTPVDQRPPTRNAYTPFIPPLTSNYSTGNISQHSAYAYPTSRTPISSQHTNSQQSLYATPQATGAQQSDYFFSRSSYTSGTAVQQPLMESSPRRARATTPGADDDDDWVVTDAGHAVNRSSTISPEASRVYDIENKPSPQPSPLRKDAKQKPKWVSTLAPAAPLSGSLSSRHTGSASLDAPGSPLMTRHFGPAPVGRVHRRNKALKRVQLTKGNLVLELDVPPQMVIPYKREPEMSKVRYQAVHGDPDDFERNNFILRQNMYQRTTELCIIVTMFNEDEILFCRTLYGIMQNISHLCSRKNSRTWGPDSWKKVSEHDPCPITVRVFTVHRLLCVSWQTDGRKFILLY
jgi:chitin synthase